MTKPFVNAKTLEKVVIVGSDSNKILEILEGYIETKYIPTRYGGLAKVKYEVIRFTYLFLLSAIANCSISSFIAATYNSD